METYRYARSGDLMAAENAVWLPYARYTLDYDKDFEETLDHLVNSTGATTKADVIRRAVASYSYLKGLQKDDPDNNKIAIADKANNTKKEIVLPCYCNQVFVPFIYSSSKVDSSKTL